MNSCSLGIIGCHLITSSNAIPGISHWPGPCQGIPVHSCLSLPPTWPLSSTVRMKTNCVVPLLGIMTSTCCCCVVPPRPMTMLHRSSRNQSRHSFPHRPVQPDESTECPDDDGSTLSDDQATCHLSCWHYLNVMEARTWHSTSSS